MIFKTHHFVPYKFQGFFFFFILSVSLPCIFRWTFHASPLSQTVEKTFVGFLRSTHVATMDFLLSWSVSIPSLLRFRKVVEMSASSMGGALGVSLVLSAPCLSQASTVPATQQVLLVHSCPILLAFRDVTGQEQMRISCSYLEQIIGSSYLWKQMVMSLWGLEDEYAHCTLKYKVWMTLS